MKGIIKISALLLIFAFMLSACSSSKNHYKPKRKNKRGCDCSGYTLSGFKQFPNQNSKYINYS